MELQKEKVFIGEKEFEVQELTCPNRKVLLNLISECTASDIMSAILPILEGFKLESKTIDFGEILKTVLSDGNIVGGIVISLISVLDLGASIIVLSVKDVKEEDEIYIKTNMTMSQESSILLKLIELNKLPNTIKNYSSLLKTMTNMFKEMKN